jgi:hypothetical protein
MVLTLIDAPTYLHGGAAGAPSMGLLTGRIGRFVD